MQRNSKYNTAIVSKHKQISIQLSLDGFSFCITDIPSSKILAFVEYIFKEQPTTPELLYTNVVQIFNQDKDLQQDFDTILVIHKNELSTLVPDAFFDQEKLKTYLNYNVKILADDYITSDTITKINAKNVYIPFVNINNYLFQGYGEFEFKHHSTILIEKLIDYSSKTSEKQFFVNVFPKTIDVVVTQNDKLLLYNQFSYNTKEDFIYYILFVAEQLQMNPDEFKLIFLGKIDEKSDVYKITYKYIRNISFIEPESDFFVNSDDFLKYSNYILIS